MDFYSAAIWLTVWALLSSDDLDAFGEEIVQKIKGHNTRSLYFPEGITKAMDEIFSYPMTIIEAPMGYGKSTAIREYLKNTDANILWQRIYDKSTNNFWHGFCHLLAELDDDRAESLVQLGFPNDSKSRQEALNIIAAIKFPQKTTLVIDDYHLIDSSEANSFFDFLVQNEVGNLHIIITARYAGFLNIDELILKGYLLHITKAVFEFSVKDIKNYYKICGIGLTDSDGERLFALTEGWISALYLFMMNYDAAGNYLQTTDIHTLIDHGVFKSLDGSSQELLINMCVFNAFTLEQARYVWQDDIMAAQIDQLVEKNAFVTYDFMEKTYTIHSILKSFLKEELNDKARGYREGLYKRAALWFMDMGDYLFSMRYSYLAGDFASIYMVIERDKGFSLNSNYKDSFIRYFAECPREIKDRFPDAMLIFARRMFTFNEMELFKRACEEFMANLQSSDRLPEEEKNRLLGEYELLQSFTVYNDIEKMSEYHQRASKLLKSSSRILDGRGSWTFGSPSVLYMFYRAPGELEKEVQTIKKAMPFYYQVANGHGKGAEDVMDAERYFYGGDFENAEIAMHRALRAASEVPQTGIIICAVFLQIRLALIKGNFPQVLDLLKKMREEIYEKKWYLFMHTLDVCESYIYASLKISKPIQPWIRNGEFQNTRLLFPAIAFLNIVYGRTLLIEGEYLKLIGCTDQFIRMASVFPNLLGQIHTYIYLAAANKQIFRQNEAIEALKQALEIALPDRVYMPFVENGDYIKPLLEEIYRQGIYCADIARILQLYQEYAAVVEQITRENFTGSKPALTERELAITQLVAAGFSNKEVGKKLFVSQNTVKTQMKSIFLKLEINSRVLLKQYLEEN